MRLVKTKRSKNLSMSPRLVAIAEGWCEANDRQFSPLMEELLREFLREKGLPVDAPPEEVAKFVEQQLRELSEE